MKKRHLVNADTYTVSDDRVIFSLANTPTASITMFDNTLNANIQGAEDLLQVKRAGILDKLNWLILGFSKDDCLARLVIEFSTVNLSDLYRDLSSLFERADISLTRTPPPIDK
jgi:hypothetical protein